jgi:hypothetical protein
MIHYCVNGNGQRAPAPIRPTTDQGVSRSAWAAFACRCYRSQAFSNGCPPKPRALEQVPFLPFRAVRLQDARGGRPRLAGFAPGVRTPLAGSCRPASSPPACSQNLSKKEPHGSTSTMVTSPDCPAVFSAVRPIRSLAPRPAPALRRVRPPSFSGAMIAASLCSSPLLLTVAALPVGCHDPGGRCRNQDCRGVGAGC